MLKAIDMYGKELLDKEVVGANGWKIGKSKDIYCEPDKWQITYLDIELKSNIEEELGMIGGPLARNHLPIPIQQVQGVGDVITLKTTKEQVVASLNDIKRAMDTNRFQQPANPLRI